MIKPNQIIRYTAEHFLSYNDVDGVIYGGETTAIVLGQMQLFLILNGNHCYDLEEASREDGLQGCIDYFIDHINQANKMSEHTGFPNGRELLGQKNIERIADAIADQNGGYSYE